MTLPTLRHAHLLITLTSIATAGAACVQVDEDVDSHSSEIVGGVGTEITQLPWQVSLQTGNGFHFCGGSIVSDKWIVTAAHCVEGGIPAQIVAGTTRLSQAATGQTVPVVRGIVATGYQDASLGKDVALLELGTPLTLNGTSVRAIRPVTAADAQAGMTAPGVLATVSGWGALASGGNSPDTLQSVQVPIVSLADASADYNTQLSQDQIAAGVRGVGGKDSCQGDSGGPMVVTDPATGEVKLAGIVSWGIGCADPNYPGMYARVSSFFNLLDDYAGGLPSALAGDDKVVNGGDSVTLDAGNSSDVGVGSIVSYEWVQTLGAPVELNGVGATAGFTAPMERDDLEFQLTVTDDRGNTATDVLRVTVNMDGEPGGGDPNDPPGGGDPNDPPGGGNQSPSDIVGGCSASTTSNGSGLMLLFAAFGLALVRRRKRRS